MKRALFMAGLLGAALSGCARPPAPGERTVQVQKQDLVIDVEVNGVLRSLESESVGPPPEVHDVWEFKIIRIAPEGGHLAPGEEAIAFDSSELERRMADFESEVASIGEELKTARAERSIDVAATRLQLEEAEARKRKADLKADRPSDLTGTLEQKTLAIDRALAAREVEFQHARTRARFALVDADLSILETRLAVARGHVDELRADLAAMSVKARRAGTVIYEQNWRGEKKKVGDDAWRGETILEISALDKMAALGQVDEVDASHLTVGQRVGLRLEAHSEREYPGEVTRIADVVRRESPESRIKVVGLDIKLLETDPMLMRPGMRFRGHIEIARVPSVLQIPLAAVVVTDRGAHVEKIDRGGARTTVAVTLGRRGREMIEVLSGLAAGDHVALRGARGPSAGDGRPGGS